MAHQLVIYAQLLAGLRMLFVMTGLSAALAAIYGLHGLRVLGYNCWCAAHGEDVAKLQGGWGSDGHRAYARDVLERILSFAQIGATYAASHAIAPAPLDADSAEMRIFADSAVPASEAEHPLQDVPLLPGVYVISHIVSQPARNKFLVRWQGFGPEHDTIQMRASLAKSGVVETFTWLKEFLPNYSWVGT